uniref:Crystallin gamma N n=1 Tax=Aotus nancymaae TaxID=37293 RepID=A0A2K5E2T1_AOTNA
VALRSGKITLYEGKHFTGRKLEVFGDCDNFQDRGFMNRVNSIRVESRAWVWLPWGPPDSFLHGALFLGEGSSQHPPFLLFCLVLEHGEHFRLEILEGCNFTGQCLEFLEDCPFLQSGAGPRTAAWSPRSFGAEDFQGLEDTTT